MPPASTFDKWRSSRSWTPAAAFAYSSGPRDAKIACVGEAWGEQEERQGAPLVGYSGQEFTRIVADTGLARRDLFLTNVFALRPPNNNIALICGSKAEVGGRLYNAPMHSQGKYIFPEFLSEVERLAEELKTVRPNIIIAMGNTAAWALLASTKIGKIRGAVATSTLCPGIKVIPTYHPASVLRQWSQRPIVLADFMKARRESHYPEIRRPRREVTINPTLAEIEAWITSWPRASYTKVAIDIETLWKQIEIISFSRSPWESLAIPFIDRRKPNGRYWSTLEEERCAWEWVRYMCALPCEKETQNGMFDYQYLWLTAGIPVAGPHSDTMLRAHATVPEMQKGLGFLGSIHTDEPAWKLWHRSGEQLKREE